MSKNTDLGNLVNGLFVDSSSRVGIGTQVPTYNLQVNSSGTSSIIHLTNSTTGALTSDGGLLLQSGLDMTFTNREAGRMSFETSNTERMRIASNGVVTFSSSAETSSSNMAIYASTNNNLYIQGSTGGLAMYADSTRGSGVGLVLDTASKIFSFTTNGSERMRITSGGNVGIGTSSPSHLLHVKGSGNYDGQIAVDNGTTTGGGILYIKQNNVVSGFYSTRGSALGNTSRDLSIYANDGLGIYTYTNGGTAGPYVASGGTSWTSSSDERLKTIKNIIPNAIESILKLRAVIHTWKYDAEEKEHLGLIAQDLQKVYPQVVVENDDDIKTLGVNYTELIPVLVKAIQELSAEINILKQK